MDLDERLRRSGQLLDDAAENAPSHQRAAPRPRSGSGRKVAAAIAVAAAVLSVLATTALLGGRDDVVVASEDPDGPTAPTGLPADLTVEAAVQRLLPGYVPTEGPDGGERPWTTYRFVHDDNGSQLEVTIYRVGGFNEDEMGQLAKLPTPSVLNTAWLGADEIDLRSVYLLSDGTDVGVRVSSTATDAAPLVAVDDLVDIADQLVGLPAAMWAARGDSPPPSTDPRLGTVADLVAEGVVDEIDDADGIGVVLGGLDGSTFEFRYTPAVSDLVRSARVALRSVLSCEPTCGAADVIVEPGNPRREGTVLEQFAKPDGRPVHLVEEAGVRYLTFFADGWVLRATMSSVDETDIERWVEALEFNAGPDGWPVVDFGDGIQVLEGSQGGDVELAAPSGAHVLLQHTPCSEDVAPTADTDHAYAAACHGPLLTVNIDGPPGPVRDVFTAITEARP